jgi:hypothetical protein
MNDTELVSAWNNLVLIICCSFSAPVSPTFSALLLGWVLTTGRHTISGIIPFARLQSRRPHDAYHYLFPHARWRPAWLWEKWTRFVVGRFVASGRLSIDLDDTLFHKSGRKVDGAGWWRDAVRSTGTRTVHAFGLNLVLLTLRVTPSWGGEPIGIPINLRLHRKGGPSLLELAEEMIIAVADWLPGREFSLCADGFYASLAGHRLPRCQMTSRMRYDAAIYDLPPQRRPKGQRGPNPRKGARLSTPKVMAAHVRNWVRCTTQERGKTRERLLYVRKVLWYKVCGAKPVRLVISRDPAGVEEDDFFFTTDLEAAPQAPVAGMAGRWSIEDTFRNTKQFLGAEEPQVWKGAGPERAAHVGFLLYGMVWTWYLLYGHTHGTLYKPEWYAQKKHPSFQDALYALRGSLWRERIFSKFEKTPVPARISRFLSHALAACA